MKAYFTFTKKGLAVIIATTILSILLISEFAEAKSGGFNGSTNKNRIDFILGIGYTLDEENIGEKNITIPLEFSDVYKKYNELQKQAGFNLEAYKGKKAVLYTYKIETPEGYNGDVVANIIVSDGKIIGGDISSSRLDGFMLPLCKTEE